MAKRRDRRLQLVDNFLPLFRRHVFGLLSRESPGFFRGQCSQIEMGRSRQPLVVRQPRLQVPFAGLRDVALAVGGTGLIKRGDRRLGGVCTVQLLSGRRELFPSLVEVALFIPPQSIADHLRRIVGPTDSCN